MNFMFRKIIVSLVIFLAALYFVLPWQKNIRQVQAQGVPAASVRVNNQHGDSLLHAVYFNAYPVSVPVNWETTGWEEGYLEGMKCHATGNGWKQPGEKGLKGQESYTFAQPGIYNFTITCGNDIWGIAVQDWVVAAVGLDNVTITPGPSPTGIVTLPPGISPSVPISPPPECTQSSGDANKDSRVDLEDYQIWQCEYLNRGVCSDQSLYILPVIGSQNWSDFNCDNKVDLVDFEIWRRITIQF